MEAGGGRAPLCCLLCHCSPPTPCLPPPPRVCPPGAPRGGEVGAGGGGGCCAHWETFRNWENSAGVVPPPSTPSLSPSAWGGGGGEGLCPQLVPVGWGALQTSGAPHPHGLGGCCVPPTHTPPLGQTPRQPGEHQPVGVTIFFGGGMTGDGGTGPGCIQPPQGGGRQSWVSPPPPLGGVALNPPTDSGATVPTLGTFAVELQPWPFPAGSSGWWGGGGRGGARNLKIPGAARCRDHPPPDWVAAGPSCPFETPGR